jgi:hypothetical protein
MAEEKVSDLDAMKALVDETLSRFLHPDVQAKLQAWRDQHTTSEEADAALTDEERAQAQTKKAVK